MTNCEESVVDHPLVWGEPQLLPVWECAKGAAKALCGETVVLKTLRGQRRNGLSENTLLDNRFSARRLRRSFDAPPYYGLTICGQSRALLKANHVEHPRGFEMPMKKSLRSLEKAPPPKKPNHLSTNSPLHGLSFARPVEAIFFPKPPLSRRRRRTGKRLSKRVLLESPFSSLPPLKKNLKTLESVKNMLLSTFSCWSALSPHNAFSPLRAVL